MKAMRERDYYESLDLFDESLAVLNKLDFKGNRMSILQSLTMGGVRSVTGDLSEPYRKKADTVVRKFAEGIQRYGLQHQVKAARLKIQQCNYLFVAKDSINLHFIFVDLPGQNTFNYRDFSSNGKLNLQSITSQIEEKLGNPIFAFSCLLESADNELDEYANKIANEYVISVVQSQNIYDEKARKGALHPPEITTGIEKFKVDYPEGQKKTAFIIMQFGNTLSHINIVNQIKSTLSKHGIIGVRADDKEYLDDLLANIKVYMHACDFGIGVFERITEDNFNPNVSLEVGYMMGMRKEVLLLKDQTLKGLQTDLAGKLYKLFDTLDIEKTLPEQIEKWLKDKGFSK